MFKEWIVSSVVALGLLMGSVAANADVVIDAGPGDNVGGGSSLYTNQWLAVKFTTSGDYTVTSFEGWMNVSSDGMATLAIYSGEGSTPAAGTELFSTAETLTQTTPTNTPDWRGAAGLSWSLPAGTYWATFEVRPGQVLNGAMPHGATSLEAYSFYNGTTWQSSGALNFGVRIMGDVGIAPPEPPAPATPVPTMSAYGLVLTMLGLLLVAARRLRASAKRS